MYFAPPKPNLHPLSSKGGAFVSKLTGKKANEFTRHDITNIEQNRVISMLMPNGRYVAATHFYWGNNFAYKECIEKKYRLLNSTTFQHFTENNLFINVWLIDQEDIDEAIGYICDGLWIDLKNRFCFDFIYIFDGHVLIEIDIQMHNIIHTVIPDEYVHEASKSAAETITAIL